MNELLIHKVSTKLENDLKTEGKYGATFKCKRMERMKTLSEICRKCGISISYLSKIENDILKPNTAILGSYFNDMQIDEDMVTSSEIMDKWYLNLVGYIMGINDCRKELIEYLSKRDDFQSRLISFAMQVKEKKVENEAKIVSVLLYSIELMQPLELTIFILTLVSLYIDTKDYFLAGRLLKELTVNNLFHISIRYWYINLKFELSLYQSSLKDLNDTFNKLCQKHITFNHFDAIIATKEKYVEALAYMMEPKAFDESLLKDNYLSSYRISLILHEDYDTFLSLDSKKDVASILYYDVLEDKKNVLELLDQITFTDSLFQVFLKNYFIQKYKHNNSYQYLREALFSEIGICQHYYASKFIFKKLSILLTNQHKYKESSLASERIYNLNRVNRNSLANKDLL
ncbi:MAG: helix-turn-helix transcriptional regulator [Acholeplasmataceae bacterium]|nr:helix-turn-helix transcriptional regulator [Acholeplasmataceae bacterium]